MASIYKRNNSPFWWLKWRNPKTGKIERFSTRFKVGTARERQRALILRNEFYSKEIPQGGHAHPFDGWVDRYIKSRGSATNTVKSYLKNWRAVSNFLREMKVLSPEEFRRSHCYQYVDWCKANRKVKINTVITDLKILCIVMSEAVSREWITHNPCRRLGIKTGPVRQKGEISDDQMGMILAEIEERKLAAVTDEDKKTAHFLSVSFDIARRQGIRMGETHINLADDVDWTNWIIRIKGKTGVYETVLNPDLIPLFNRLKSEGRRTTFDKPRDYTLTWFRFFQGIRKKHPGFENISFHSTRVTVASRLERAGMPEHLSMRLLNHASTTIHRIYRRVKQEELTPYWSALNASSTVNADKRPPQQNLDAPPSTLEHPPKSPGDHNAA